MAPKIAMDKYDHFHEVCLNSYRKLEKSSSWVSLSVWFIGSRGNQYFLVTITSEEVLISGRYLSSKYLYRDIKIPRRAKSIFHFGT